MSIVSKMLTGVLIITFLLVSPGAQGGEKVIPQRAGLGLEIGNWQPHRLNDDPSFTDFGAAGATPFYALSMTLPIKSDLGIRLSAGYWSLHELAETDKVHSLTLHPLCLDLKYWLVPNYRLSTYVMYGGGVYWGVENETTPFGDKLHTAIAGWGANLGAGIDFALSRGVGIGLIFQYHLVRFREPLGGVDDFSGAKVGAALNWYF